ncbi:hypothetical protein D3C71_532320 [compost metagenome]
MNPITSLTKVVAGANKRLLTRLLRVGLPRYGKRLLFVVSLFAGLKHLSHNELKELEALNEKMSLASCTEALEIPVLFSKRIWGDCDLDQTVANGSLEACSLKVVSAMPSWLQYSDTEKMLEDARTVMQTAKLGLV